MNSSLRRVLPIAAAATAGGIVALGVMRLIGPDPPPPVASGAPLKATPVPVPKAASAVVRGPPQLLYLPDGGDLGPGAAHPGQRVFPGPWKPPASACPEGMVQVSSALCIDRYESILVDVEQGRRISPYYHPRRGIAQRTYGRWRKAQARGETALARSTPVPAPPSWQLREDFEPRAVSKAGQVPNGYLSRELAERACKNAGKRLCTRDEWVRACRGAQAQQFPYGDKYQHRRCNVFRESHPAAVLHGNASINHTDPRLNQVAPGGKPLLRKTGGTPECASRWGGDVVFDMVGNLDEWVADPDGVFVGGFFSRSTRAGCDAKVSSHGPTYFDYSLGTRCCRTL